MFTVKRSVIAVAVALYLYFGLPATAVGFYELYHLVGIDAVYWGYSAFKAAGYYLGAWGYKLYVSLAAALLILFLPPLIGKLRGA